MSFSFSFQTVFYRADLSVKKRGPGLTLFEVRIYQPTEQEHQLIMNNHTEK